MNAVLVFVVWIGLGLQSVHTADDHFYVDPTSGDDNNDGTTVRKAFKTVAKAVLVASRPPYNSSNNVVIDLMAGYHELSSTLYILRPNLLLQPYHHQEVHLVGGKRINNTAFKPVTDATDLAKLPATARQHVKVVDLPSVGITNYGHLDKFGTFARPTFAMEIFYNGKPLQLPSYPKKGYIDIVKVPDPNGLTFKYNDTIPSSWSHELDPWVYGYIEYAWSDQSAKVDNLNTQTQTVTLHNHVTKTIHEGHYNITGSHNNGRGGYFRFINILSALSEPGEYYVDRTNGKLYIWPPTQDGNVHSGDIVYASMVDNCIHMDQRAYNVQIQHFTVEACRRHGFNIYNVKNVKINNMEVKNTGLDGMNFGGNNNDCLVSQCLIHDTNGGILISGGNRTTLESSGNIVEHNEIYSFSRHGAVGYYGIQPSGVGTIVRNNHIYSARAAALLYNGNDFIIEKNLIHDLCQEADYCDCVIAAHDLTTRGTVVRFNIFHDMIGMPWSEVHAINFDDHSSGHTVTNNVFYNNVNHLKITGGRDNIIKENLFYNAKKFSLKLDRRTTLSGGGIQSFKNVPYTNAVWSLRYPELAVITKDNSALPEGNLITRNIFYNDDHSIPLYSMDVTYRTPKYYNISETGLSAGPGDHNDVNKGDYRVRCSAGTWANQHNIPQFVSPNDVGPQYSPGPKYLNRGRTHIVSLSNRHPACTTKAPATEPPMPAYLPDGTGTHVHYNVTNEGCWLSVSQCGNHTGAVGTYRDMYGERYQGARDSEEQCLKRAADQWRYCGSNPRETVAAIYGPTGATSYGGQDCVFARYGCPKHGGPADGSVVGYHNGTISPEYYSINILGANNNESVCLSRATAVWNYCGSHRNHPVTMIYKPTGATRTAGAGCWIKTKKCDKHPNLKPVFYDAWGATNRFTDDYEFSCLEQAEYYWNYCGFDPKYPVTAEYRPTTNSATFPTTN